MEGGGSGLGKVKKIPKEPERPEIKEEVPQQGKEKISAIDALNMQLKSYLKGTLSKLGEINNGVEAPMDVLCDHIVNNELDDILDYFFDKFKESMGIVGIKKSSEGKEETCSK